MPGERRLISIKSLLESILLRTSTTVTNTPLRTKEDLTPISLTSSVVNVANVDTLILPANPDRKYLLLQRGTTIGRVFVHFGSTAATITNGMLTRENEYFTMPALPSLNIYTGEIRAIATGGSKILYVTEGV